MWQFYGGDALEVHWIDKVGESPNSFYELILHFYRFLYKNRLRDEELN